MLHNYIDKNKLVENIEEKYNAKFIGNWEIPTQPSKSLDFSNPVYCFHVEDPDTSQGHTNYFGIKVDTVSSNIYILDALSITQMPIKGMVDFTTNEVIISKYRHDFARFRDRDSSAFIDGGSAYLRFGFGDDSENYELIDVYINDGLLYNSTNDKLIKLEEESFD